MAAPDALGTLADGTDYSAFLVKLGVFVATFAATYFVGRLVAVPLADRILDSDEITPTVRRPARRFVRAAIIFVAFFAGLFFARLETLLSVTGSLAAALTLAVGFASRDILGNLVGGLFIITDPMFNIGDWIEWNENEGIIEDISFRVTRVRTFKNELITVPNSMLASNIVTNHTIRDRIRVDFPFSAESDADIDAVRRVLLSEAAADPRLLDDPAPEVIVSEVSAAGIDMVVQAWIDEPTRKKYLQVRSAYLQAVTERLARDEIDLSPDLLEVTGDVATEDRESADRRTESDEEAPGATDGRTRSDAADGEAHSRASDGPSDRENQ